MRQPSMIDDLRSIFADPPTSAAPMLRWWWFGPSVERDELSRELTAMARAGFGGVEVAYVYPLGPATTEFMSDAFLADLRFAADYAHKLGLRFDLTLGSGWSFGGPHITGELAARQLHWDRREVTPGSLEVPVVSPWPGDQLVAAYIGAGSSQEQPESYQQLPVTDGVIKIPDGNGTRQVLLAYARRTGQNVKRAAVGSEGPVLDHYSASAAKVHLRWAGDRMLDAVPAELVGSVFCDSLEVYDADWTPALPEEFARRRGYPLIPVLYWLAVDGPNAVQVRADYHHTLAELYQENFVAEVQRWAAGRGVSFRIQNYGTPPATISSYRFADMFEGEGWRWKDITQTRWASSAGHLYGRDVISAEIWTWVHSPSFRATPLDLKGEAHEHLLNGINQLIGHGWPYSPTDTRGLGWFFYAAGAIDDRNPWWPAMPRLNTYLSRLCWLMRQGEPVADVAVYVPNEDLFAVMGREVGGSLDTWREARRRIATSPEMARRAC
jgi:alpha-L-rhamnosidase